MKNLKSQGIHTYFFLLFTRMPEGGKSSVLMKKAIPKYIPLICLVLFLFSCQTEDQSEVIASEDDQIVYITYVLQDIDSVRYWGDSDKIRLRSSVILLNPAIKTYQKKFTGTADETLDPAQANWSKESSGKYSFSADSSRIYFSNDTQPLFYFPGSWNNGSYHQPRLEQHDSVWYSISYFSMTVSGRFIYSEEKD